MSRLPPPCSATLKQKKQSEADIKPGFHGLVAADCLAPLSGSADNLSLSAGAGTWLVPAFEPFGTFFGLLGNALARL